MSTMKHTLLETGTYITSKAKFTEGLSEIVRTRAHMEFPSAMELRDVFSQIPRGSIDKKTATGALSLANWKDREILSSAIEYVLLATSDDDGKEDADKATAMLIKMSNAATLLAGFNQTLVRENLTLF